MDASEWAAYPPLLPEAEVVPVDLPGHGTRLTEEFTGEAAVETIRAAVDGASPGQPVVLAGHSLGGYLAMLYADRHPSTLASLVLIGSSAEPVGPLAGVYRRFADLLPLVGAERMARASNAVMRRLGAGDQDLPGAEAYAALPAAWQVVFEECRASLLEHVDCPIFLVNGQFDQMRVHARRYAAAGADTHVVTVPRATHLLPITHPEQVAEVLREALSTGGVSAPAWQVDFWLDPSCPLTRHTARWLRQVGEQVPLEITWRVMSLSVLNEHRDEDPEGDPRGYLWIPARIATAVQTEHGSAALGAFYEALWTTPDGRERSGERPAGDVEQSPDESAYADEDWLASFRSALDRCGLPRNLADTGLTTEHDEALRDSHQQGVGLVDAEIGTPILRLTAPDGTQRAFFGPVLDTVPHTSESLAVWESLTALVGAPAFRELKA